MFHRYKKNIPFYRLVYNGIYNILLCDKKEAVASYLRVDRHIKKKE